MKPKFNLLALCLILAILDLSCSNDSGMSSNVLPFTVSGRLVQVSQQEIPSDAEIVVAWDVGGSPDYVYIFGKGTIVKNAGTFSISFDGNPPARALTGGVLGVGFVLITNKGAFSNNEEFTEVPTENILGAAANYGVIFVNESPNKAAADMERDWLKSFKSGYNVGKGIKIPDDFDGFEPVDPTTVEVIIDDLDNLEFVNWT
ncbi:MAG: hypothetical protein ACE5HO_01520 [bacterium]